MVILYRRFRALLTRYPTVVDTILAAVLTGLTAAGYVENANRFAAPALTAIDYGAGVLAFLAVAGRRRWPRALLIGVTATLVWYHTITGHGHPLLVMAAAIVAYTVAAGTDRRTTLQLALGCGITIYVGNVAIHTHLWAPESLPLLLWMGMATAFGDATRSRRAYLAAVEERARRAEQTREEEAQRRVIQERLRIARELHDVVAHHIAVINVQAAAASHLLDRRPEHVRPALDHIRLAGDAVLKELGSIVGVLRQSDDPDTSTEPTPGLARLPELLTMAGLDVTLHTTGEERPLPALADLAAFRIVQEALTNAHKYGTGTATLTLTWGSHRLGIDVTNTVATGGRTGSGYGIVGMRERAAAAGGRLDTRHDADNFTVTAELPAEDSP
ncbi:MULTISPECIES: histidine kinase [Actinoplanes]|uniref:sensor histidine kinase n=1 Tax=Actinoplanes TaxID=1865 RepID=UPI0005F2FBA5|nr:MULTISPECIES: histidine kinase [Actinoplanes]GLY02619.1 two-component sensor histidine kinase [Actinoplanes sp. NBRC 101535]